MEEYLSSSAVLKAKEDFKNIACIGEYAGDAESLNQIGANTLDSKDYYLSKDVNETPQVTGSPRNKGMYDVQLDTIVSKNAELQTLQTLTMEGVKTAAVGTAQQIIEYKSSAKQINNRKLNQNKETENEENTKLLNLMEYAENENSQNKKHI